MASFSFNLSFAIPLSSSINFFMRFSFLIDHFRPEGRLTVRTAVADFGEGLRYIRAQKALLALRNRDPVHQLLFRAGHRQLHPVLYQDGSC